MNEDKLLDAGTEYDRLLYSLNINRTVQSLHFVGMVANLLGVAKSEISNCVENVCVLSPKVLGAAQKAGINPDYITKGAMPMYLKGYTRSEIPKRKPKKIRTQLQDCLADQEFIQEALCPDLED